MSISDVLSPFTAWKNLFRDPVTIKDPLNERPGAARYRGFHKNDMDKCIGCGTCETICQNGAIDMLPVEGITKGFFAGLSTLALVAAMDMTNGGLYAALMKQYGSDDEAGAFVLMSIESGPLVSMIILGSSGAVFLSSADRYRG